MEGYLIGLIVGVPLLLLVRVTIKGIAWLLLH